MEASDSRAPKSAVCQLKNCGRGAAGGMVSSRGYASTLSFRGYAFTLSFRVYASTLLSIEAGGGGSCIEVPQSPESEDRSSRTLNVGRKLGVPTTARTKQAKLMIA